MKKCFTCQLTIGRGNGLSATYDFGTLHFCDIVEHAEFHKGYVFGETTVGALAASKWLTFAKQRRKTESEKVRPCPA